MSSKITFGELLSLSILVVMLASGGYTLRSDIAQVEAQVVQVDTKVDKINQRVVDLQERMVIVETIVRSQATGVAADI